MGNLFASYFLWKDKILLTHSRISSYNAGQEILIGTPESIDAIKIKVTKFSASKRGFDLGHDEGRSVLQGRPPSGAQGGNV